MGWLLIVLFLPGFIAGHALYWSFCLANASVIPVLAAIKRQFVAERTFEDEYSGVAKQLEALRQLAEKTGNDESLRRINAALVRVQAGRSRTQLAQVARSLENLEFTITGIDELGREFPQLG